MGDASLASFHARRVRNMKDITLGVRQLRVDACEGEQEAEGCGKDLAAQGGMITLKGGLASPMLPPPRAAPAGKSWRNSRRKELSHILLRGLWRWKDGNQAKKRRRKNYAGQSGSETGVSSENLAHLQHPGEVYRGGLLSEGGQGFGGGGDASGSDSSAAEGFYYSSGGGSGRGSVKSATGKRVVRRVRRLPPLSPGSLAPLATRTVNQAEQHRGLPAEAQAPAKSLGSDGVPSKQVERGGAEQLERSRMAPEVPGRQERGAGGEASAKRSSLQLDPPIGLVRSKPGSRPTSATLSHSGHDSGYGSELGYGGDGETGYGDESYGDEISVEEEEWDKEGPPPAEYWRLWEALVAAGGLRGRHRGGRGGEPLKETFAELMRKCDPKDGAGNHQMAELITASHARVKRYQQRLRRRRRHFMHPLPPHPQPHPVRRETEESSGDCSLHSLQTSVEGAVTNARRSQEWRIQLAESLRKPDMNKENNAR